MIVGHGGCYFEDHLKMQAYLKEDCEERNNLTSCNGYATNLYTDDVVPWDYAEARDVLEEGCSAGHVESCASLAYMQMRVVSIKPANRQLATQLNTHTCALGSSSGCSNLAFDQSYRERPARLLTLKSHCEATGIFCDYITYYESEAYNTHPSHLRHYDQALKLCLEKPFNLRHCDYFMHAVRDYDLEEEERAYARIAPTLQAFCDKKPQADICAFTLRQEFKIHKKLNLDSLEALETLCVDKSNFEACEQLGGILISHAPDREEESAEQRLSRQQIAQTALERACDGGNRAQACKTLSQLHLDASRYTLALEALDKACDTHLMEACYEAGKFLQKHNDDHLKLGDSFNKEVERRYRTGCMRGHTQACHELAKLHYFNRVDDLSRKENHMESLAILEYNCNAQAYGESCYFLSGHYQFEKGVKRDQETYERLISMACQYDARRACLDMFTYMQGDPATFHEKIVQSSEQVVELARARIDEHYDDAEAERYKNNLSSPAQRFKNSFYRINSVVSECSDYINDKEQCDYIKLRHSAFIKTAYKKYREQCQAGDAESCFRRGMMNLSSVGKIKSSHKVFMKYFEAGCKLGHSASCSKAAKYTHYGYNDTPQDSKKALRLSQRGCALSTTEETSTSQGWLGVDCKWALGIAAQEGAQLEEALTLANDYCAHTPAHRQEYCREQIWVKLAPILAHHPPSEEIIDKLGEQALASQKGSWITLHARLLHDLDPERSLSIATAQCESTDELKRDCSELGRKLTLSPDTRAKGIELLDLACHTQRNGLACHDLAMIYAGSSFLSEQARSREAFEQGCERDDGESCRMLAELHLGLGSIRTNKEEAEDLFLQGCHKESYDACLQYSEQELFD